MSLLTEGATRLAAYETGGMRTHPSCGPVERPRLPGIDVHAPGNSLARGNLAHALEVRFSRIRAAPLASAPQSSAGCSTTFSAAAPSQTGVLLLTARAST